MSAETPKVQEVLSAYATANPDTEQVTPGYKHTEVGVIPEDWNVVPLLSATHLPIGQVDPKAEPYRSMVLVAPDHVESRTGRLLSKSTASEQNAISGKYLFSPGQVVYSKIRPYLQKAFLADFEGLCSADMYPLTPAKNVSPGFIIALLLGHRFSQFAENVSARSGIPKVNREELAEHTIALPPLSEQRAIAAALSEVDNLISALDKLIAKKRDLKTAAMQQLLAGEQRLPGFSGEWETKRLGDLVSFFKGSGLSKSDLSPDGSRKCIHYGELFTSYGERIEEVRNGTNKTGSSFLSKRNDVLMPTSDVTPNGLATASCISCSGIILGSDILVIRAPENLINGEFLAYAIKKNRNQVMQLVSGTTVFHLYGRDMANFTFSVPSVEEQSAIANVLSDMGAEIEAFEARREKTREFKRGMMQELLSGRTRLI